jgi:hypothetical protein
MLQLLFNIIVLILPLSACIYGAFRLALKHWSKVESEKEDARAYRRLKDAHKADLARVED